MSRMFAKGYRVDGQLYRFDIASRFRPENLPPILSVALPHLTDDCDALYAELEPAIRARGPAPVGDQYLFLFEWLCRRLGREMVVERSGASLMFVAVLGERFPSARFVHIHRDGRDAAVSMQNNTDFRLIARFSRCLRRFGVNPYRPPFVYGSNTLYGPIEHLTARLFPLERWLAEPVPVDELGRLWSDMVTAGMRYLQMLPPRRLLTLRYEDVLARPREELTRFAEFLGPEFRDDAWLEQAARIPRRPPTRWQELPALQRERLAAACRPGLQLLGYA
jgi:hypothetical protein